MALNATQFPPSQIFSLSSKTAVITGGTRGLGLNCASGLMLAGCSTIIITSRKANACEKAKRELEDCVPAERKGSVRVFAFPADLSLFEEVERFVKEVDGVVGKTGVDILVANAGATWGEKFDTHPDSAIAKVFDLNVRSVFNLIRLMTPLLTLAASPASPSRVITISSIAGIIPGTTNSNSSTFGYSASKAAVIHLTKNLALELGPRNILVNSIAPGFFVTKMAEGLINSQGGEGKLGKMTPNGRLGKGEDIAGVAVFLSSPASSHINGAVIPLDGGRHLDTRAMGRGGEDEEDKAVAKL